jgi:hypothetical protein
MFNNDIDVVKQSHRIFNTEKAVLNSKERGEEMLWNYKDINFLYPPDVFMGSFDNEKMQARHEELKKTKLDALKKAVENEQDPLEAMMRLHKRDHIPFLLNNSLLFKTADRFEKAIIKLYRMANSPFLTGGDFAVWCDLFESCDPEILSGLGAPIPFSSTAVYRISVTGREKSLSWTINREIVKRFEQRWYEQKTGHGKIYTLDVTRENIMIYLTDRQEEEVILHPKIIRTAKIRELPPLIVL